MDYTKDILFKVEGWMKVIFIVTTLLYLPVPNYKMIQLALATAICVLGVRRQINSFTLSLSTLRDISLNEFGCSMLYVIFLLCVPDPSMAFYFPLVLYFLIGVSEFITRSKPSLLTRFEKVMAVTEVIKSTKDLIKVARAYCEVVLFFYVVVITLMGKMHFLAAIMCFNYLRLKGASKLGRFALLEMKTEVVAKVQGFGILAKVLGAFFNLLTSY